MRQPVSYYNTQSQTTKQFCCRMCCTEVSLGHEQLQYKHPGTEGVTVITVKLGLNRLNTQWVNNDCKKQVRETKIKILLRIDNWNDSDEWGKERQQYISAYNIKIWNVQQC